jgi:hypothetical protein
MYRHLRSELALVEGPTRFTGHSHQPRGTDVIGGILFLDQFNKHLEWRFLQRPFDSRLVAGVFDL